MTAFLTSLHLPCSPISCKLVDHVVFEDGFELIYVLFAFHNLLFPSVWELRCLIMTHVPSFSQGENQALLPAAAHPPPCHSGETSLFLGKHPQFPQTQMDPSCSQAPGNPCT